MLSKIERFKQWRDSKSDAEQHILNSALLIFDYVNSVSDPEVIKENAKIKYKEFDRYKVRSWATAAFVKLFIDEAIAQLPIIADQEIALLTHSSGIVSTLYDNWKDNTTGNIFALIGNIEKLLALDSIPFTDKNQYKAFLLSSCMLFHIIKLAIDEVQNDWRARILVAVFLDLEQIKPKLDFFLLKIDERLEQLKQPEQLAKKTDNPPDPLKPAKDLLNKRYYKALGIGPLISTRPQRTTGSYDSKRYPPGGAKSQPTENQSINRSILDSLTALEADIDKVSSGIFSLIELRKKKADLETNIEAVNKLFLLTEENERKIVGRKDFLDFIEEHTQLFQILLENAEEPRKQNLLEKIKRLKSIVESPDLSSNVIHGVSWVAAPITVVYRTATPQTLQNMLASTLPSTLDSDCKAELKEIVSACLLDLRSKLKKKEHQIAAINNRFFNQNEALKLFIANESIERLAVLQKANDAMKEAVQGSFQLLTTVKENTLFLHGLQEKSQTLSEFIKQHDGFFVRICNFLARHFACFKTVPAKMIDDAAAWKIKIDELAAKYQSAVDQGIRQIEQSPNLDDIIKIHIKSQFKAEEHEMRREKQNHMNPNKRNVRLLMNSLSHLFATKPQRAGEQISEMEYDEGKNILMCF